MAKISLDKLKEQRDKLNARIQQQEARLKQRQRKIDTRKKILVGSYFLYNAIKENKMDEITLAMDKFLTRNSDRTLFNLDPLSDE